MNKGDYIPTLDDMVEEDYRDKIIKILNDTLVGYINDEKTNLIKNYDYNKTNNIITYRKIRDENNDLIEIVDPVVISTEYEERETIPLFKYYYMLTDSPEKVKIRDIKNGITIRLPFCKVELCLSGKPDNPYTVENFLDVIISSSDGHKDLYSVDIKELTGKNYDPEDYSKTRGGEYDWHFKCIDGLFDRIREIIKEHHKDNEYKIELYDRIFKSISLSVLHVFKVIHYKLYKD